jgi:hypothetical protein
MSRSAGRCRQRRRQLLLLVLAFVGAAGCSTHSAASVDNVARSVPAPSGLTFTGITDQMYQDGLGAATHEANAGYTNPPMPCSQLLAAWTSSMQAAHWTIDKSASTFGGLEVKRRGYLVIVNLGNTTTCNSTIVGVR